MEEGEKTDNKNDHNGVNENNGNNDDNGRKNGRREGEIGKKQQTKT